MHGRRICIIISAGCETECSKLTFTFLLKSWDIAKDPLAIKLLAIDLNYLFHTLGISMVAKIPGVQDRIVTSDKPETEV